MNLGQDILEKANDRGTKMFPTRCNEPGLPTVYDLSVVTNGRLARVYKMMTAPFVVEEFVDELSERMGRDGRVP